MFNTRVDQEQAKRAFAEVRPLSQATSLAIAAVLSYKFPFFDEHDELLRKLINDKRRGMTVYDPLTRHAMVAQSELITRHARHLQTAQHFVRKDLLSMNKMGPRKFAEMIALRACVTFAFIVLVSLFVFIAPKKWQFAIGLPLWSVLLFKASFQLRQFWEVAQRGKLVQIYLNIESFQSKPEACLVHRVNSHMSFRIGAGCPFV